MSGILQTHFPAIAVQVSKDSAKAAIERMKIPLETALGNLNTVINKLEMRESMSTDEKINIGCARNLLMDIEVQIEAIQSLLSQE